MEYRIMGSTASPAIRLSYFVVFCHVLSCFVVSFSRAPGKGQAVVQGSEPG
jgi:hypothetical protein